MMTRFLAAVLVLVCCSSCTVGFVLYRTCLYSIGGVSCKHHTGFQISSNKCGKGGDTRKIIYSIKNLISPPTFFHTVILSEIGCNDSVVTRYMEKACDLNKDTFNNFSTTYFPGVGYYVSALNGVSETSGKTYWEMIEHTTGQQYQVGHDTYIPQPGDHVAWNLTFIAPYQGPT